MSLFDLYLLVLLNFLNDGKLLVLKDVLFRFFFLQYFKGNELCSDLRHEKS